MKLIAARCPACGRPLAPGNDDLIVVCEQCSTAVHLGEDGLAAIPIRHGAPSGEGSVARWMPFWVFDGQVSIMKRERQGGDRAAGEEAVRFWARPRRFYVPAWEMSLEAAQSMGIAMLRHPPRYRPVKPSAPVLLVPAVVMPEDARKLVQFIVLAIEARRKDWLKDLDFRFSAVEPELWALPERLALRGVAS